MFEKKCIDEICTVRINLQKATLSVTEKFREFFLDLLKTETKKIIVDFKKCEYVNSTFLGTLVACFKIAETKGATLKIVVNTKLNFIFCDIAHLHQLFSIYNNIDEAIFDYKN